MGTAIIERTLRLGKIGAYQLQAAIAAVHANAASSSETDWQEIAALYAEIEKLSPNPVVTLNRAVAVAMSKGLEQGLAIMDGLAKSEPLAEYYLLHAARADVLTKVGRDAAERESCKTASELAPTSAERRLLDRRLR